MIIGYSRGSMYDFVQNYGKDHIMVNPVNLKGVMGRGVALWFREHYPKAFHIYRHLCLEGSFEKGDVLLTTTSIDCPSEHWVAHVPTKDHYLEPSTLSLIRLGLRTLDGCASHAGWTLVTTKLGCGLGGLDWEKVRPLLEDMQASVIVAEGMLPQIESPEHGHGFSLLKRGRYVVGEVGGS